MSARTKRLLGVFLAVLLMLNLAVVAGCAIEDAEETSSEATTDELEQAAEETAAEVETAEEEAVALEESIVSEEELHRGALEMAQAYFLASVSDFTAEDFDWKVKTLLQDDEGVWWARVIAAPHEEGYETEQIFVTLSVGATEWDSFDMGTGVEPEIDDRFPEEIRDEL